MKLDRYKEVKKLWGREFWIINNDKYCMKVLAINPGWQCSLHMHPIKDETFFVLEGLVNLEVVDADGEVQTVQLGEGDTYWLVPETYHRFSSATDERALVMEVSTTHSDDDVVRKEDSRPL